MPMSDGSIDFRRVLEHSPNPYMLLDAELHISWANHAYLAAVGRELDDIAGSHVFEAFPGAGESHHLIESSFERVLETGEPDEIAHLKYDIPNASGGMDAHIWSTTQVPILDDSGAVRYILQHPVQITKIEQRDTASVVRRAEAVEQRWRGATKELERLRALLEQAPGFVAVLAGPEHRFVMSNAAYRRLIGERDLDGKSVAEALPEIAEQGFVDILDKVMETGEPYFGRREKVMLKSGEHDELRERHLEFIFQPISGPDSFDGVLVQGYDVTEEVLAEDSQRILINELNHRVKNTLAVVQGLAQQSFKGDKQNPQLDIFVERLAALASAHSLLTERRWESADLRTIVRGALEDMLIEDGADVVAVGSLEEGLDQAEAGVFDFAILDINLHGEKSYPIAFRLGSKGVRFVFASGYGDAEHPEELAHVTTLTKPYVLADIRNIAVGG